MPLPVGRYQVWTGFLKAIGWYFLVSTLRGQYLRPRVALVGLPAEFADALPGSVEWSLLKRPRLPGRVTAAVIDPHAGLDLAWSCFLTTLVLRGLPVYHRHHFEAALTGWVRFTSQADNDFGALLPSLTYQGLKRLLDLGLCVVLCRATIKMRIRCGGGTAQGAACSRSPPHRSALWGLPEMIAVSGMTVFSFEEDPVCAWPSHNRSSDEAVYDFEERPPGGRCCGEGGDEPGCGLSAVEGSATALAEKSAARAAASRSARGVLRRGGCAAVGIGTRASPDCNL